MSRGVNGGRGPADHREGLNDLDNLVPLHCRLPEELIVAVEQRAAAASLTVDQFVCLAIAETLPGIIADALRWRTVRDGNRATWPGPRAEAS